MAEAQLRQFLEKVRQLNAFVALSEADPQLRQQLRDCESHDQVVALARRCGFEIGRRWGEAPPEDTTGAAPGDTGTQPDHEPAAAALVPGSEECPHLAAPLRNELKPALDTQHLMPADPPASLLAGSCPPEGEERTDVLLKGHNWRLERIHSCGAVSPEGFWYDQTEMEWVTLLQGTARLRFADEPQERQLQCGDSLLIRAGRRHRVTETAPGPGTIWLALFWHQA